MVHYTPTKYRRKLSQFERVVFLTTTMGDVQLVVAILGNRGYDLIHRAIFKHLAPKDVAQLTKVFRANALHYYEYAAPDAHLTLHVKTPPECRVPLLVGLPPDQVQSTFRLACANGYLAVVRYLSDSKLQTYRGPSFFVTSKLNQQCFYKPWSLH
jgi:hypothetical protein